MKKIICCFLFLLTITLLVSCSGDNTDSDVIYENLDPNDSTEISVVECDIKDFTYFISEPKYLGENSFFITVSLKNTAGANHGYYGTVNDFRVFSASLYCETENGRKELKHLKMPEINHVDCDRVFFNNAEEKSFFHYELPENFAAGEYTFEFVGVDGNEYSKKMTLDPSTSDYVPVDFTDISLLGFGDDIVTEDFTVNDVLETDLRCDGVRTPNWFRGIYRVKEGDVLTITYAGGIRESRPAQFKALYLLQVVNDEGELISVTKFGPIQTEALIVTDVFNGNFTGIGYDRYGSATLYDVPNYFYEEYEIKQGDIIYVTYSGGVFEGWPAMFGSIHNLSLELPDGTYLTKTEY